VTAASARCQKNGRWILTRRHNAANDGGLPKKRSSSLHLPRMIPGNSAACNLFVLSRMGYTLAARMRTLHLVKTPDILCAIQLRSIGCSAHTVLGDSSVQWSSITIKFPITVANLDSVSYRQQKGFERSIPSDHPNLHLPSSAWIVCF
jgi:hypothetical protein